MKHKIFAVYDDKVEAFLQPFFLPTVGAAMRAMMDCVNDRGHAFHAHAEDYALYQLGEFDDSNAVFALDSPPKSLGLLIEFKKTEMTP